MWVKRAMSTIASVRSSPGAEAENIQKEKTSLYRLDPSVACIPDVHNT